MAQQLTQKEQAIIIALVVGVAEQMKRDGAKAHKQISIQAFPGTTHYTAVGSAVEAMIKEFTE